MCVYSRCCRILPWLRPRSQLHDPTWRDHQESERGVLGGRMQAGLHGHDGLPLLSRHDPEARRLLHRRVPPPKRLLQHALFQDMPAWWVHYGCILYLLIHITCSQLMQCSNCRGLGVQPPFSGFSQKSQINTQMF